MNNLFLNRIIIDWSRIEADSYLRQIDALQGLTALELTNPVTFFAGENGSGKSTLLEAIAIASGFNPEGGSRNYAFSTYDSHSPLCDAIRLSRGVLRPDWGYFLRAESFYNVATAEEEYAHSGGYSRHFHQRSHGEGFLTLVEDEFRENGLYFLDEPEAALSPQSQLTLLLEIHRCAQRGAQFLIATHSPILLGLPGAEILRFDDGPIHSCRYEETDSYLVTSMFLNRREQVLKHLFSDEL